MADTNKDDGVIELDLSQPEPKKADDKAGKKVETGTPEAGASTPPPVEDAVETLKKQLADEKAGRATDQARARTAEEAARQASDTAVKSQTDTRAANLSMVESAIGSVKREQEILEANLANAMQAQDFAGAAKIQTQISTAAAKLVQLETGKEAMEAEAKQPIRRMDPPRDPVEAFCSQLSPRSAAWVRAHPEYATDQRLTQKMVAAHNLVVGDIPADTDEYFSKVETLLGLKKADETTDPADDPLSAAAEPVQQRRAPPSAPVTRSGNANGQRPNTVTLTAAEREIAELNGMTDREYAAQKLKIQKEKQVH